MIIGIRAMLFLAYLAFAIAISAAPIESVPLNFPTATSTVISSTATATVTATAFLTYKTTQIQTASTAPFLFPTVKTTTEPSGNSTAIAADSESSALSTAAIAGIAAGGVVVVVAGLVLFAVWRSKKLKKLVHGVPEVKNGNNDTMSGAPKSIIETLTRTARPQSFHPPKPYSLSATSSANSSSSVIELGSTVRRLYDNVTE
ncbi:hypothetical protein HK100_009221 [Physocladia obscura]|uniref:Mid2 domain-containing protein n=1 Tax=Physocladia obscura TaxID=109957 RepID=A0AAD5T4M1_9FUNG|nr:hypothetical protein HK100_009221 [Physocladia obscura]